jgi:hypothetical protein
LIQNKFVKLKAGTKKQKSDLEYSTLNKTSENSLNQKTSRKNISSVDFRLSESLLKQRPA